MKNGDVSLTLALFPTISSHVEDLLGIARETMTGEWFVDEGSPLRGIDSFLGGESMLGSMQSPSVRRSPSRRTVTRTSSSSRNGWDL